MAQRFKEHEKCQSVKRFFHVGKLHGWTVTKNVPKNTLSGFKKHLMQFVLGFTLSISWTRVTYFIVFHVFVEWFCASEAAPRELTLRRGVDRMRAWPSWSWPWVCSHNGFVDENHELTRAPDDADEAHRHSQKAKLADVANSLNNGLFDIRCIDTLFWRVVFQYFEVCWLAYGTVSPQHC